MITAFYLSEPDGFPNFHRLSGILPNGWSLSGSNFVDIFADKKSSGKLYSFSCYMFAFIVLGWEFLPGKIIFFRAGLPILSQLSVSPLTFKLCNADCSIRVMWIFFASVIILMLLLNMITLESKNLYNRLTSFCSLRIAND